MENMHEFKKFIESTNVAIERAIQLKDEALGTTEKIVYDQQLLQLFKTADKTFKLCEKLKSGINAWLNPNQVERLQAKLAQQFLNATTSRLTSSGQLANDELAIAQELCEDSGLAFVLLTYSAALKEIGRSEKSFISEVQNGILTTLNTFIKKQWPEIQKERRILEEMRLDYASLRRKLEHAADEKMKESLGEKCEAARHAFESQLCSTKLVLEQISTVQIQALLSQSLKKLAADQVKHHEHCLEVLHNLTEALGPIKTPDV
uniref:Endophilin-B2 n=1 Tax=Schistocephalus solidus TaxID=70667 RepID=A0A0X3PD34_SCHSO